MFDFLSKKISSVFDHLKGATSFTDSNISSVLEGISDAFLEADVPFEVVENFTNEIKSEIIGKKVSKGLKPDEQLSKIVYDKLLLFLGGDSKDSKFIFKPGSTVMVMGLQGSGKTTSLSKLAHLIKNERKNSKILLGSVDFYRPAAVDQLEILAKSTDVGFYRAQATNPVKAAIEIKEYAKQNGYDIILLDTAGRLHVDKEMLNELSLIKNEIKPDYNILVLDSMTGQESLAIADSFNKIANITGAILSKMDSDTKGGLAFSFKYVLKKPILFVGVGEKKEDLETFRPERIAGRIIGMGDLKSLMEKADQKLAKQEQDAVANAFKTGKLTLSDFAKQLEMVGRLGSLSGLMKYMPGFGSMAISQDKIDQSEKEIKKFKAIIGSMTLKERNNPSILDLSRKNRIAKGSGVKVDDVNLLLARFSQSQQMLKMVSQFGPKGFFR